jgi:hypothetical protein
MAGLMIRSRSRTFVGETAMRTQKPAHPVPGLSQRSKAVPRSRRLLFCGAAICMLLGLVRTAHTQLSTQDHVAGPGFWPTKGQDSFAEFAGEQSCAGCHVGIARSAIVSSMRRTAMHADAAEILKQHPHLEFRYLTDIFRIETTPDQQKIISTYSVADGTDTLSATLLWVFGTGRVGQSYLFKKSDGNFYEARLTFFQSLNDIGFTPARDLFGPTDISTAMGRQVGEAELIRCFSCHATAVNIQDRFNESGLRGGVTCEACHGPGAAHVAAMSQSSPQRKGLAIFDPSRLSPTDSVEFCGSCHGSWWDVRLAQVTGPSTVRSAPYRLVTSKCWQEEGDPRLVCTACHDPHKELVTDEGSYDAACLRCHALSAKHAQADRNGPGAHAQACPVAKQKCASCHMPQVYVREMKSTFTDHRIRIVRPGDPFKD